MKAKDLMIGDYVNYRGQIIKVTSLYDKGGSNEVGWSDKESVWVNASNVEPIPITPEILEKNGFERSIDRSWGNNLREIYGLTYDVDVTYKGQTETFTHEIEAQHHVSNGLWDVETTNGSIILNIEYVHQLQQAMRLCGIEKEIVL